MRARFFLACALAAAGASAPACCGIANGMAVEFLGQRNILLWDEATHTEEFIRSAAFSTEAKDFGFIAPTPTIPELGEIRSDAFLLLDAFDPRPATKSLGVGRSGGLGGGSAGGPVVIQVKEVAGYLATTLLASDAKGLAEWMRRNGYATTPGVEAWTAFYIRKNWYLTAFKVLNPDGRPQTGVVKMRFATAVPYNPYLVPRENLPKSGTGAGLGVHVLSKRPLRPRNLPATHQFRHLWSNTIEERWLPDVRKKLKADWLPANVTIQYFEDRSFPNRHAQDDLYFEPVVRPASLEAVVADAFGWVPGR